MSNADQPLTRSQVQVIRRLVEEADAGRRITVRTGISGAFGRRGEVALDDLLSERDREQIDLDDVEVAVELERWIRWVGLADQPSPPSPPPPAPDLPDQLGPFRWDPITFDNGVPVGGWAELTLNRDGSHEFSGHFHDSGAPSYNGAIAWVIKDTTTSTAYTVQHAGHMAGTFESGSRDDDWDDVSGPNAGLAAAWPTLTSGWVYDAQATMNGDFNAIVGDVLAAVGIVLAVAAL